MRVLITGGGTGGHLFPAIAVAEEFQKRFPRSVFLFVGTGRSMDQRALMGRGYETRAIHCGGFKGGTFLSRIKSLFLLPLGFLEVIFTLRRFQPDLIFGVGGYVTGPVLLAGKILGVWTSIHEQNSVPGLANRQCGRFVDHVFLSLPGSGQYFSGACTLSGNPVRKEFLRLREDREHRQFEVKPFVTVLVLGGSLGAHQLNCLLPQVIAQLIPNIDQECRVIHQTGVVDCDRVRADYKKVGLSATVEPFFDAMAEVMAQADLIVCRAGATTLAELMTLGKPSILVPYPYAADDHQTKNASYMVEHKAALMASSSVQLEEMVQLVGTLLKDPTQRAEMGQAAFQLAKVDAAAKIVDICLEAIGRQN